MTKRIVPDGYVYFITDEQHIKIGFSGGPVLRLADLQVAHPLPLRIMAQVASTPRLEGKLHRRFNSIRTRPGGEWFHMAPELLAHMRELEAKDKERQARAQAETRRAHEEREKKVSSRNTPAAKACRQLRQAASAYPNDRAIVSRTNIVCSLLQLAGSGDTRPDVMHELRLQIRELEALMRTNAGAS